MFDVLVIDLDTGIGKYGWKASAHSCENPPLIEISTVYRENEEFGNLATGKKE